MYTLLPMLLLCAVQPEEEPHRRLNPLYRDLVETGLLIQEKHRVRFPPPVLPEGDAAAQKKALKALLKEEYTLEDFVRPSLTGPRVCRVQALEQPGLTVPVYSVDLAFVAHGDMKALAQIERFNNMAAGFPDRKHHFLTAADLAKRKLEVRRTEQIEEQYLHETGSFLNRLRVGITSRAVMTRTSDSFLIARSIAPQFVDDAEFPCFWQILQRVEGKLQPVGPRMPFPGTAGYSKITRLKEPAGALFLEFHIIYAEPKEWFDGANLLRSRLPLISHIGAMALRADIKRWSKPPEKKEGGS